MSNRKTRLVDCNPRWVGRYAGCDDDTPVGFDFDCPEGHEDCRHAIPFTPAFDGATMASWQPNGAIWQRTGDTFETLTLSPSINTPLRADTGCAFHGFITNGEITFCGDSK